MSEAEKRERIRYKRNRKRLIFIQATVLILVTLALIACSLVYQSLNKIHYVEYTESGSAKYKVLYHKSDEYDEWIKSGNSYIASLVKAIYVDFGYMLDMEAEELEYEYTYGVDATLEIFDEKNGLPVYSPTYVISSEKTEKYSSSKNLDISELVVIDYAKYDAIAKELIEKYHLSDVKSTLIVKMNIDVVGNSKSFEDSSENSYTQAVNIPLTQNTFRITTSETVPGTGNKVLAYTNGINQDIFKYAAIALACILLLLIICFISFIYLTRNDDINYTIRVRRLVSAYESYIQKITNVFDQTGYQILKISSFNEMLAIRDTIQSPILMSENEDQTATKFLIPTNTKILYTFEIRVDNYDQIYGNACEETDSGAEEPVAIFEEPVEEPACDALSADVCTQSAAAVAEDIIKIAQVSEKEPVEKCEQMTAQAESEPESKKEIIIEAPEAPAIELICNGAEDNGEDGIRVVNGEIVHIRYRTSFTSRLIRAGEKLQAIYTELKNEIMAYARVKARTSWGFESFNKGRLQLAKLNVKGASVQLYLALDTSEYSAEKYFFTDVSDKPKVDKVPMLLKVKGAKGMRNAIELIGEVMSKNGIERGTPPTDDYRMPYESTEALVDRGLVKVILPDGIKIDENTVIEKLDVNAHLKAAKAQDKSAASSVSE